MLIDAMIGKQVTRQTHLDTWNQIVKGRYALTPIEFQAVIDGITKLMIDTHDKVTVPGFKAKTDWTGLPWGILYDKPAQEDEILAAWMLGLMAIEAFKRHPAVWITATTVYNGRDIPNKIYWKHSGSELDDIMISA